MTRPYAWPAHAAETFDVDGWPVIWVRVTTPGDQAPLHRYLAKLGYCPVLINDSDGGQELWRFHHPDGPTPW